MDDITKAVFAAAADLQKLGWYLDDAANGEMPDADSQFVRVLVKHFAPFGSQDDVRKARIAALKAELATLEST